MFLNLPNISFLFSSGIIFSSAGSCYWIWSSFDIVTAYAILFPKKSPALWATFLDASSPVSIFFFFIFSSTCSNMSSCSWFNRISLHFYLLMSNFKLILTFISKRLIWSANVIIILSNLVLYVSKNTKLLGSAFNK